MFRAKNVIVCGYDNEGNINKLKVNKNGELNITNNIINNTTFFGGNLINDKKLDKNGITNIINVNDFSYCKIFYEDDTISKHNYISIMGILDNYTYYELAKINLVYIDNYRKGSLLELNIIGIKDIFLQNYSVDEFEYVTASLYAY